MSLEPGQTIGRYRIVSVIGEGGMGIVYLAEDTRLGRQIALKVLPAAMSSDPARRARLEREARAIAALNHPNIVTLHSVEEVDGNTFLTMELLDGRRLSQLLPRDGLDLHRLLEWSLAIADALVAAHRQGVVHRDLKPDNIMVTSEGRLKVLDFGLAKLRESALEGANTALPTSSITEEGKIVGTVSYMSPEQAEGKPLDHRSDIFSFGVVLYEMATGRRPFQGETAISTISSILKDTPPPAQEINTSLPPILGRVIRRCLAKEPVRRYQSTDDLRNELLEVKEESDSGELSAQITRERSRTTALAAGGGRSLRPLLLFAVVALAAVVSIAAWLWRRDRTAPAAAPAAGAAIQLSRITRDGKVQEAAISPDGRHVAYVRRDGADYSLRLRQVATGDEVQVVAATEDVLTSPWFSSDGDFLDYVSIAQGNTAGWAYRVSMLGGAPRRIVDGVWGVAAAPDGRRLALSAGAGEQVYIRISGLEGDAPRDLAFRKGSDHFDSEAAWSSDGATLAIVSHRFGKPQQVVLIDAATGQERELSIPLLHSFGDLVWIPGRSSLVVAGSESPVTQRSSSQLWEVSTSGDLQPITHDLNSYSSLTITADGATIAAVQVENQSGIEIASVRGGVPGAFSELYPISASRAGAGGIGWLAGNQLVHGMMQAEVPQIFVTDPASRAARALTTGISHREPSVSRDGRTIVVIRDDGDRSNLWHLDPDTGRERRLSEGWFEQAHVISPDGKWVTFLSARERLTLMKVPIGGGPAIEVASQPVWCLDISADQRDGLCFIYDASGEPELVLFPLEGGAPRKIAGLPDAVREARFGPDGRSITYLMTREGDDELWSLPPGGTPQRLARFEGKRIVSFAWSPDGSQLAVVKASRLGDVVLLKRAPG